MTPPLWDFALTPEQGLKIALIGANWAMVDNELGHLLERLSGIADPKDGADLVHVIDLKKKVDILDVRRKKNRVPSETHELIRELVYVANHYRPARNLLAHGIPSGAASLPIVWSQSKLTFLHLDDLDAVLSEAYYAAHVMHHLTLVSLGSRPLEALPPRPPARPVREYPT